MATFRGTIPDFQLANPIYTGARVTFFTVDDDGVATSTLATLYANPTGSQTVANPQTLDSEGKFTAPVYISGPVIAEVVGANVATHRTGVIQVRATWRGDYAIGTVYFSGDLIRDPVTGDILTAAQDFTASVSVTSDINAGNLVIVIDQTAVISGGAALAIKVPCRVATTANITLSGLQTIDGVTVAAGDRVLVKDQADPTQNGIYNAASGAWTRAVDCDESAKFGNGAIVYVLAGTVYHNRGFQLSITTPFTLGTSSVTWAAIDIPNGSIPIQIGAASDAVITTGVKGFLIVPFDCTVDQMSLFANAAGSIVIDIYKGTFPTVPTSGSICGSSKPTLSAAQFAVDATLTGWTKTLKQGDVLAYEVLSAFGLQFITLTLRVNRN